MLVTAFGMWFCTPNYVAWLIVNAISLQSFWGLSVMGTNLLAQRYFLEKAKNVVVRLQTGRIQRDDFWTLQKLRKAFHSEICTSMIIVPFCTITFFCTFFDSSGTVMDIKK